MSEITRVVSRFERWLIETLPRLTATESQNVHIDQLAGEGVHPKEQVELTTALFGWAKEHCRDQLSGKIATLLIPLRNSERLDQQPPRWGMVPTQLSDTPPSIYIMNVSAFMQPWLAERYIVALTDPDCSWPGMYYECWRNLDDPDDEGWTRNLHAEIFFK